MFPHGTMSLVPDSYSQSYSQDLLQERTDVENLIKEQLAEAFHRTIYGDLRDLIYNLRRNYNISPKDMQPIFDIINYKSQSEKDRELKLKTRTPRW